MSGVYQLEIPSPYNSNEHLNVYLLKDEDSSILIDTGWNTPETLSILDGKVRESGCQLKDIRHIIITHAHFDHFGLAGKLNELIGAELILHEAEAEAIDFRWVNFDSFLRKVERYFYQQGVPTGELADFLKVFSFQKQFVLPLPKAVSTAKRLKGNEELCFGSFRFRVLLTPGHSPGHICLYEPERKLLFSGDHILFEGIPFVAPLPGLGENPLGDFVNSFQCLSNLEVNLVLPGHGSIFGEMNKRIEQILYYIHSRQITIAEALEKEPKTTYEIGREIFLRENKTSSWSDLSSVRRALIMLETLGCLQLLSNDHKLDRTISDNQTLYSRH